MQAPVAAPAIIGRFEDDVFDTSNDDGCEDIEADQGVSRGAMTTSSSRQGRNVQ